MRSFTAAAIPPDIAPLLSTPKSLSTGGYRHLLDDDRTLRSPPYLDTIISPSSTGTLSPPVTPARGIPTLGLGLLDLFPTELLIPILCHLDIRTLLHFRALNRHALSLVDLCPGYLPIRTHAPNILRGILAIEAGPYWTLSNLWIKLRQKECDSPPDACRSKEGSFAGYLCLLKRKRYCWGGGGGEGEGPWRPGPWREIYHGWPGPMKAEFAVTFFGLDEGRLQGQDPKVLEMCLEPRIRALPRAELPDEVRWKVSWGRVSRTDHKYGVESGTWPGKGPGNLAEKGKGERLVLLDTETVFGMVVYLGFDPEKEMKSCSPLSKQLQHCWARYVKGNEVAFLAKGMEAAIKAGVDLDKVTPPDSEKKTGNISSGWAHRFFVLGGGISLS
ncbi:hypothetical protein SMACR_08448 [Sordaria macrospora]|uniref:WGS project CABT00000000 data, contig 2.51 n=2 Tax=Sordaria macrospora TaxID=5147 RepID=F7W9E8_SORMK|nr:uncharacterized protein SMAC_08448 [Sordaria macrospora k-hell]KAA8629511.1 hypothetical protein SMACR_08448 [Sordaria macrospora]WPJ64251.1 hypothetical protein SMAC4_08448 [Sordaria macrospora]CCC13939.1 unnamed protein product [Sordaria macrospora k-hell]